MILFYKLPIHNINSFDIFTLPKMNDKSNIAILIADDDEINQVVLKHIIIPIGLETTVVSDGVFTMEYLQRNPDKK